MLKRNAACALLLLVTSLHGADVDRPLPPDKAQAAIVLPPELTLELVACEPQVQSPVEMAFDENGILYVVEMLDYPNAVKDKPPLGRIVRLEDVDGDGRYENQRSSPIVCSWPMA